MKRYFMVRDEDMPTIKEDFGVFHYIDLVSHGEAGDKWNLFCLTQDVVQPKKAWIAFPPLYDARTTLAASKVPHEVLTDIGLTGEETCVEAVVQLGEIHPQMGL
jgi:hypothetical protein